MAKTVFKGLSAVVTAGLLAAGVCLTGYVSRDPNSGKWFQDNDIKNWAWNKSPNKDDDGNVIPGAGGAVISGTAGSFSLFSAAIPASEFETYGVSPLADTAYTLTAQVEPVGATDYFEWTVSNNDDGAITLTVSDDRLSAVLTCNKAFDVQKVVTIASTSNSNISASCTVDYYKRFLGISYEKPTIKLATTATDYKIVPTVEYSIGTILDTVVTISGGEVVANQNIGEIEYTNYGATVKFSSSEKVTFTGDTFTLIMSPNSRPSFCGECTSGPKDVVYGNLFKGFVSAINNPKSAINWYAKGEHYTIKFNWSATRNGETIDSGSISASGEFDVSDLVIEASDVVLPDTSVIF